MRPRLRATPADNGIRAAARAYAARGWSVIPVEPRGKRPLLPWTEFQRRIAGAAEIDAWYRAQLDANVAVVTGRLSDLVVIDVDPRHGGEASLARLQAAHGPLPVTAEVATGGGGRHLYFAHPPGELRNRAALAPGIDLRGDGGCVVAPPSRHKSGRTYAWAAGRSPDEIAPAALPRCFLPAPAAARPGHPPAYWRTLVQQGVNEGRRNETLASLAGHLLWHGVEAGVALELLLAWNRLRCRPPLPDHEVAQVVGSIARLHRREADG